MPFLDTLPPLFWNHGKEISPCTKRRPQDSHGGECKEGNQIRKSFTSGQGQAPLGLSLGVSLPGPAPHERLRTWDAPGTGRQSNAGANE